MTHTCCPSCRVRFSRAAAAVLEACPSCGDKLHVLDAAHDVIGFRLATDAPEAQVLSAALAASLRVPQDPRS
jgi:predicted  nucleic acid-binding Zn-ribbon protein